MDNRWRFRWVAVIAGLGVMLLAGCMTDANVAPTASAAASSGRADCDACHPGDVKNWKETYHAKVARAPHGDLLKEAAQYWTVDSKGNPGPSRGNLDGKLYAFDDVEMVVGHPLEAALPGQEPGHRASSVPGQAVEQLYGRLGGIR